MTAAIAIAWLYLTLPVATQDEELGATTQGLTVWVWDLGERLPRWPTVVEGQAPNAYYHVDHVDLRDVVASQYGEITDMFAGRVWGWIDIDEPGLYRFRLRGDDGAQLRIDGETIVDTEWGEGFTAHGAVELSGGRHTIEIPFYEDRGRFYLSLHWQPPGTEGYACSSPPCCCLAPRCCAALSR